jgi:serine/threonine-protein kinase HipA
MSLAGVQSKLGVVLDTRGQICIPLNGAPSTHILKPDVVDRLNGSVQNEALCLTLAKLCDLDVPDVTTGVAGARTYLLVNRYDRRLSSGRWRRLHQEDFCQALGKPPAAKYEHNRSGMRGPTLAEMFALVRDYMTAQDTLRLLDQLIFTVLVNNTDAHAKNYSIMISAKGFSIAPMYDVMTASAWPNITKNLANSIAGQRDGRHLKRRHWERQAKACGLSPKKVVARVAELADAVLESLPHAVRAVERMPAGGHFMLSLFADAIAERRNSVALGLRDTSEA